MQSLSQILIWVFSTMTLAAQIGVVIVLLLNVFRRLQPKDKSSKKILTFISNNYVLLVFLIAAGASAGSIVMSDILGFLPCKLCWYQRIFLYPQVIIAGTALFINDSTVRKYLLPLSIIGGIIAVYHILLQIFPTVIQCGDEVVSCATNQFVGFGYITIPVMSLTSFLLILAILVTTFNTGERR